MKRLGTRKKVTVSALLQCGTEATLQIHRRIHNLLKFGRAHAIQRVQISGKDKDNVTTAVDVFAERAFMAEIYDTFEGRIPVYGEESLQDKTLDLSGQECPVAIVDMVDGTDLLALGIWLWCSAVVFFLPSQRRILAAIVGDPFGRVYYALGPGKAFVTDSDKREESVECVLASSRRITPGTGPERLQDAFFCFYGQKSANLLSVVKRRSLVKSMHRIYNFAGNPMMVKVADGTMSCVFELIGQYPHDVVPGAFIAECAGATLTDLSGNRIDLAQALLRPAAQDSRLKYILACKPALGKKLRSALTTV